MNDQTQVDALLVRYEELRSQEMPISPEELCRDCPELLDEVKRQIQALESLNRVLATPDYASATDKSALAMQDAGQATSVATEPLVAGARFHVLRLYARGGLGEVHVARDEMLKRDVALKRLQALHACNTSSRSRFLREAEITSRLEHPSIVPIHAVGQDADGRPFYAMRFVQGETLHDALRRTYAVGPPGEPRLTLRHLIGRVVTVCNTVAYAHSRGIIHRDIKPGNIILGPYGETLLVDWGLAKPLAETEEPQAHAEATPSIPTGSENTEPGAVIGTPAYMSPEQAGGHGHVVGPSSDIYSLGATLYAVLTGQAPAQGRHAAAVVERARRGDFPKPRQLRRDIPRPLEAICLKALAHQPEDRYDSALALAADLEHWLADEPVSAWPEPWTVRFRRWIALHRTAVAVAAAALAVATACLAVATGLLSAANERERDARTQSARNFQLARKGVDDFSTKASADPRLREYGLDSLRKELLQTAATFYDEFVQVRSNDVELRAEQGRAYQRLGGITQEIASKEDAIKLYEQARDLFEGLACAHGSDAIYQEDLGAGYNSLGLVYSATGRPIEAEAAYRRACDVRTQLVDRNPAEGRYQSDLAASWNNLGKLFNDTDRLEQAEAAYRQALAIRIQLTRTFPSFRDYQAGLGDSHNNLGSWYYTKNRPDDSEKQLRLGLEIRDGLARDYPTDRDCQSNLAASQNNLAILYTSTKRLAEAEKAHVQAMAIRERLVRDYPTVSEYQSKLAGSYHHLGRVLADTSRLDKAEATYLKALEIQERLHTQHPTVTTFAVERGRTFCDLGGLLHQAGKLEASLQWFAKSIQAMSGVLRQEPPNAAARHCLSHAHTERAEILTDLNRHKEALGDWDQAVALEHGHDLAVLRLRRAATITRLGDHAQATGEANGLLADSQPTADLFFLAARVFALASVYGRDKPAEPYAARAVALLDQARTADYFKTPDLIAALLKDKDWEPLRARADFQKLISNVQTITNARKPG
jgi:serine/threonine-protein kinase